MVTASLPAFPSHRFGKTTGGTPTLLCPRALWSREEDNKDKPGTNPKGAWLDLPHPASQKGYNGLVPTSPKFPWEAAGEPKSPRCLHSHRDPSMLLSFLKCLVTSFPKDLEGLWRRWRAREEKKLRLAETMQGTKQQHGKGGPTQEMRRPQCFVEKQQFSATCL